MAKFVLAASGVSSGMGVWWAPWMADHDMGSASYLLPNLHLLIGQMEVVGRTGSAPLGKAPSRVTRTQAASVASGSLCRVLGLQRGARGKDSAVPSSAGASGLPGGPGRGHLASASYLGRCIRLVLLPDEFPQT